MTLLALVLRVITFTLAHLVAEQGVSHGCSSFTKLSRSGNDSLFPLGL